MCHLELKESQEIVAQTSGFIHGETWGPGQDSNLPEKMQLASGISGYLLVLARENRSVHFSELSSIRNP